MLLVETTTKETPIDLSLSEANKYYSGIKLLISNRKRKQKIALSKKHRYTRDQPVLFDKCTHCTPTLNDVKILASTSCSLNF